MRGWWYHCSQEDHGDRWQPARICPRGIGTREPKTPRLCVCSSVPDCFAAALFRCQPVHVYRSLRRYSANRPVDVWDAGITGERWLVPPVVMVKIGVVPAEVTESVVARAVWFYQLYRIGSAKAKCAMVLDAWRVLGPVWHPKRAATLVPRLQASFGDSDDLWLEAMLAAEKLYLDVGLPAP